MLRYATSARFTVQVTLDAGQLTLNNGRAGEVSVNSFAVVYQDGERRNHLGAVTTIRRNRDGRWGAASGGYVFLTWKDLPTEIQAMIDGAYREHLTHLNNAPTN